MTADKLRGPDELRAGERVGGLDKLSADIRARRSEIGLSQEELADLAGISRGTVKTSERGDIGVTLTPKTIVGIHSALGWAPRFPQDLTDGFEPVEVLSADAIREIAGVIIPLMRKQTLRARTSADRLVSEFHELVDGLAEDPPTVPDSASHLARVLAEELPIGAMNQLAREITERTGKKFQSALGRGLGALIPTAVPSEHLDLDRIPSESLSVSFDPGEGKTEMAIMAQASRPGGLISLIEAKLILESGLSDDVQRALVEYVAQARISAETSILAGLRALIRAYDKVEKRD